MKTCAFLPNWWVAILEGKASIFHIKKIHIFTLLLWIFSAGHPFRAWMHVFWSYKTCFYFCLLWVLPFSPSAVIFQANAHYFVCTKHQKLPVLGNILAKNNPLREDLCIQTQHFSSRVDSRERNLTSSLFIIHCELHLMPWVPFLVVITYALDLVNIVATLVHFIPLSFNTWKTTNLDSKMHSFQEDWVKIWSL